LTTDYNAASWTTSQLLADIRRKAKVSDTSSDYTDAVLLREATDSLWDFPAFALQQARDGRLTFSLTRSVSADARTVAFDEIELPPFAVADAISSLVLIDTSGSESVLSPMQVDQEPYVDQPSYSGQPAGFLLIDGRARLVPKPSNTAVGVRINYQRRHGDLVASSAVGTISSILTVGDGSTCTLTLSATPPAGFVAGAWVDIVNPYYPYRLELVDVKITGIAVNTLTLAIPYATLNAISPTNMTCVLSGQSPYVQLPLEMRKSFTEYAAASICRQIGDEAGAEAYEQSAREGMGRTVSMLSPRIKGTREKAVNRGGLFRGGPRSRYWTPGESW
jgi:hypothetical protein